MTAAEMESLPVGGRVKVKSGKVYEKLPGGWNRFKQYRAERVAVFGCGLYGAVRRLEPEACELAEVAS